MARPAVLDEHGDRINLKLSRAIGMRLRLYATASRLTLSQAVENILLEHLTDLSNVVGSNDLGVMPARRFGPRIDPRQVPQNWDGKDFGKRLIELGVEQKAFGEMFGSPQQTINSWARHGVPPKRLQGVARCLLAVPWPSE